MLAKCGPSGPLIIGKLSRIINRMALKLNFAKVTRALTVGILLTTEDAGQASGTVSLGSQTAKNGFRNEDEIAARWMMLALKASAMDP
jgi:hypothetical protein